MRILHICAGWQANNGAAVIGKLLAGEHRAQGHDVRFGSWAGIRELREADEVWTHCGWLPVLWWAGLWARKLVRVPEACYDPVRLRYHGWKKSLVKPIERHFLRKAAKVVATCPAEAEWIRAYARGIGDWGSGIRVEVTDLKRFFKFQVPGSKFQVSGSKFQDRKVHLLYLGRRHPLKGVEYLERAVAELVEVGSRSRTVELRMVSDHFGEELEKDWAWCDVLVLPTLSDNFGLVIAEALERGKRVMTTDGAPAWEPEEKVEKKGGGGQWRERLVYLKGYRDGTDAERVELLKNALRETLCS